MQLYGKTAFRFKKTRSQLNNAPPSRKVKNERNTGIHHSTLRGDKENERKFNTKTQQCKKHKRQIR